MFVELLAGPRTPDLVSELRTSTVNPLMERETFPGMNTAMISSFRKMDAAQQKMEHLLALKGNFSLSCTCTYTYIMCVN